MRHIRLFARESRLVQLPTPIRHALEGIRCLARHHGRGLLKAEAVACGSRLPAEFLAKLFTTLAAKGILESRRGPRGGFGLARAPRDIRVAEVVDALGRPGRRRPRCVLGQRFCGRGEGCAIHETVAAMEKALRSRLERLTLARLAGLNADR